MLSSDITVDVFLALREAFFDLNGSSLPFLLRDKRNTQDDPLDEYIASLLHLKLPNLTCMKAPGPLISPDLVVYRPEECQGVTRSVLKSDLSKMVAIEVKKLERQPSGQVARSTGLDYNTTPPCGTIRVYDATDQPLDIRGFYLFICQEKVSDGQIIVTALVLCDGNALNADFALYLQITGQRTKGLGLGTYGDGVNRQRPMLIFSNPLGSTQLDHSCTLVTGAELLDTEPRLGLAYEVGRTIPEGGQGLFYAYRSPADIPTGWELQRLMDPFPQPVAELLRRKPVGSSSCQSDPLSIEADNAEFTIGFACV